MPEQNTPWGSPSLDLKQVVEGLTVHARREFTQGQVGPIGSQPPRIRAEERGANARPYPGSFPGALCLHADTQYKLLATSLTGDDSTPA